MAVIITTCRLYSGSNSVVECNLAKVEVASSNLVSRSINHTYLKQFSTSNHVFHGMKKLFNPSA
jgi:hypothetical protein